MRLNVILADPNGNQSTLRSPSGEGTDNLNETIDMNVSATTATRIWGLMVINGAANLEIIDFWNIEFL